MATQQEPIRMEPLRSLSKDLAVAAKMLSKDQARYLVDSYYQLQEMRKGTANQVLSIDLAAKKKAAEELAAKDVAEGRQPETVVVDPVTGKKKTPPKKDLDDVLGWLLDQAEYLESQIKRALENYALNHRAGRWALSVYGIGPVISAGLLAHLDILKAPTAGAIWAFAGISGHEVWQGREATKTQISAFRKEFEPWDAFLMLCTANNKKPFRLLQQAGIVTTVPDRDMVLETISAMGGKADNTLIYEDNMVEQSGLKKSEVYSVLLPEIELDWKAIESEVSKRPYNAELKVLCWKIGQSFLKFSGNEDCYYGHILKDRWELEKSRNDRLEFAQQAADKLKKFNIGRATDAYKAYSIGKLPPAHILQRACRFATKIFLAHWQYVAWESATGKPPVKPYVFEHRTGHTGYIAPPGWPCE